MFSIDTCFIIFANFYINFRIEHVIHLLYYATSPFN